MSKFSQHHCNVPCTDVVIAAAKRATESADRAEAAADTAAQEAIATIDDKVAELVQQQIEGVVNTIPVVTNTTDAAFAAIPEEELKHGIYVIDAEKELN